jgi:hypothetical protein
MTNTLFRKIVGSLCAMLLVVGAAAPVLAQFVRIDRVPAFDTNTWYVWAAAGQRRVTVEGDGDTDLDCWVYDRYGNLLGRDVDDTDLCIIDFRHRSAGDLTIRIRNLGSVYNQYRLTVD